MGAVLCWPDLPSGWTHPFPILQECGQLSPSPGIALTLRSHLIQGSCPCLGTARSDDSSKKVAEACTWPQLTRLCGAPAPGGATTEASAASESSFSLGRVLLLQSLTYMILESKLTPQIPISECFWEPARSRTLLATLCALPSECSYIS